ncbi:MAG: signal peptidase I [Spirochaetales bacterium]|nr:signal peptidase I [Spirochaetales bacterium]
MEKNKAAGYAKSLLIGICIGILVKIFILDILVVSGSSMEPTLKDGQKILVNRLAYGLAKPFGSSLMFSWNQPEENEIIVFLYNGRHVVKRCAAVENTLLEYSTESSYTLRIKDKEYPLTELQYNLLKETRFVPEGTVLVIGDNHSNSIDSRTYGFVPRRNILGRIRGR